MTARRLMLAAAVAIGVVSAFANWYAIRHHLPFALNRHGSTGQESRQWVANGTALGPPLAPLVVLAAAAPFALARRWWGGTGSSVCLVVAAAMLFGTLGEPTTWTVFEPRHFESIQALVRVLMIASTSTVGVIAARDLIGRVRRGRPGRTDSQQPARVQALT